MLHRHEQMARLRPPPHRPAQEEIQGLSVKISVRNHGLYKRTHVYRAQGIVTLSIEWSGATARDERRVEIIRWRLYYID